MRALIPWTGMNVFKGEVDRMLDRLFEPRLGTFETPGEWWPKLDLSETKEAYVAKLEVPGVEPKETSVALFRSVPVMTTRVPPSSGPMFGLMALMAGAVAV